MPRFIEVIKCYKPRHVAWARDKLGYDYYEGVHLYQRWLNRQRKKPFIGVPIWGEQQNKEGETYTWPFHRETWTDMNGATGDVEDTTCGTAHCGEYADPAIQYERRLSAWLTIVAKVGYIEGLKLMRDESTPWGDRNYLPPNVTIGGYSHR